MAVLGGSWRPVRGQAASWPQVDPRWWLQDDKNHVRTISVTSTSTSTSTSAPPGGGETTTMGRGEGGG